MNMVELQKELGSTSYPGRGIIAGKSADGKYAISAYWTMGRSAGSRNRVFVTEQETGADGKTTDVIRTKAFDPSLIAGDPSLIIYAAVRQLGNKTIVTNGDQTDTIAEGLAKGLTFEQSLRSRKYEHDAPNYTPRISSLLEIENGAYNYALSILKSDCGNGDNTLRFTYTYDNPQNGEGHYIHTYMGDGNPLPSFEGEPVKVKLDAQVSSSIDVMTDAIWNALNEDNKVSLFVRFIEIASGKQETRIINKNK
ncbi:MAG: IMP cyclohydrolase [Treponema sp.]|nr:IMP cyclohydrolase [Treponema sp.]